MTKGHSASGIQHSGEKLLLHVCCATCSGGIIESLIAPTSSSVIPALSPVIPALSPVIPAKAGIQSTGNRQSVLVPLDSRLRGNDEEGRGNDEKRSGKNESGGHAKTAWDLTVFFYNPNIHPAEEYEKRKADIKAFCDKLGVPFVDADYDSENWFACVKGLENEPERGARCSACFTMRLARTADYAAENGFPTFATSLGISRWKNLDQVNACGVLAAGRHKGLRFWDCNWRKGGGADYRFDVAKREGFYQQKYCGCMFSKKATEEREKAKT